MPHACELHRSIEDEGGCDAEHPQAGVRLLLNGPPGRRARAASSLGIGIPGIRGRTAPRRAESSHHALPPRDRSPAGSPDQPLTVAGRVSGPSTLLRLYVERGQSPWLDHLTRGSLEDGSLGRVIAAGIRGVTANPAALNRAIGDSPAYDEQLSWLFSRGWLLDKAYLELAATDVLAACALLLPAYERSQGLDGLVSLEVPPLPMPRARRTASWLLVDCTNESTDPTSWSRSPPPRAVFPSYEP